MLFSKDIKTLLHMNLAREMKKFATNEQTVFEKDIVRDLNVSLPDGQKLSRNVAEAFDQLAAMLTGKEGQKCLPS